MKAPKERWNEFLQSDVWADLKTVLLQRLSSVRDTLEVCDKETFQHEQGRAEELRFLIDMPAEIYRNFDEYKQEQEELKDGR